MSVDKETVARIANLARIRMDDAALDRMVPELNNILAWVEQLGEVDCSGVEPMTAVIPNTLRLRDDVVNADPLTGGGVRDAVLANAPAPEHGFFARLKWPRRSTPPSPRPIRRSTPSSSPPPTTRWMRRGASMRSGLLARRSARWPACRSG
ncbi:MAG: hypothetical protein DI636_08855 [Pelagerythrobacter marensis]|nr:MAG: hypothetical protein DI636_08855 [Pelagerythrobacter marensis]